ncbi:MAG: UDP-N-acetylmuramoyl-tripeptide--D-alanyl-D-alanine ligase [bacterium]|nr:UDP-N-acetylmuramoyl-tripeptide--D-alanyl-D-alanine ligase [bacterium]
MKLPTIGWLRGLFATESSYDDSPLRISIDSRNLRVGDTFWAIRGERDGHDFVDAAIEAGASCVVVEQGFPLCEKLEARVVRVDDTMTALTDAARTWRKELDALVIGITGSVGKTTTKDYVRAAFAETRRVEATHKNFNNEIGVPLTILSAPRDTEVLICEMGAARPGDIAHLCAVAKPQWGIVTAIADAHFESFGSRELVAQTKGELYRYVSHDGVAFVPVADELCIQASKVCETRIGFGFDQRPTYWESDYVQGEHLSFDEFAQASFFVQGERVLLTVPGRPAAQAALAAMSIASYHGVAVAAAASGVSRAVPTAGRVTLRRFGRITVIDDAYNASPTSMSSALETLSLRQAIRKVVVFGDMLELGEISDISHREVVNDLDRSGVSLAILIGPRFSAVAASSFTSARLLIYPSIDEALPNLVRVVRPDDLILVKASRGMALDRAVAKLEEQFS